MRRLLLTLLGLALCTAAVVAFCTAIYDLGRIGTCASGGPYVSARPCPAGTALKILLIPGALLAGGLGIWLYAAGGMRDRTPASRIPLPTWMWAFLFLGAAGSISYAAWGPAADPTGSNGTGAAALILLVVFVPMAIVPLVTAVRRSRFEERHRARRAAAGPPPVMRVPVPTSTWATAAPPSPPAPPAPAPGSGDVVSRLERLSSLRTSGAITEAEFDRLKAQILGGG